jgi:hypothetical protein
MTQNIKDDAPCPVCSSVSDCIRSVRLIRLEDPRTNSIEGGRTRFALQPQRFPYEIQHRILSTIQQLLEESCFKFVKRWLPSVIKKHNWNCAAAGELTEWLYILRSHAQDLPKGCVSTEAQCSLEKITLTVARLRHTAVHRLHLTPSDFLGQIRYAIMLTEVLQDVGTASILEALYGRVDTHAKKMDHDIEAVQQRVHAALLLMQREKEELAEREQQLLSYAAQQNIDIPDATGVVLLDSINAVLASSNANIVVEKQQGADGVIVEDDDIDSDEEQLQAELS